MKIMVLISGIAIGVIIGLHPKEDVTGECIRSIRKYWNNLSEYTTKEERDFFIHNY